MTKLAKNNPQGTANIADDRVLAPVVWKEKCFYCEKYKPIKRLDANKPNIQGICEKRGDKVWKDYMCAYFIYNGG